MATARRLADCPVNLFIVYTPGPDAVARGYEPWLVRVDNPFFNAIPGVHHYANWKIELVLTGGPLPFAYFDFQGLAAESDLEPVWFNADLDAFRTEWVRLWGYGAAAPAPVQRSVYLMRPIAMQNTRHGRFALVTGGNGAPPTSQDATSRVPTSHDAMWRVEETIHKHYAMPPGATAWRVPSRVSNPLGLDWLAVTYGDDLDTLAAAHGRGTETVAFTASLIAAPDQ